MAARRFFSWNSVLAGLSDVPNGRRDTVRAPERQEEPESVEPGTSSEVTTPPIEEIPGRGIWFRSIEPADRGSLHPRTLPDRGIPIRITKRPEEKRRPPILDRRTAARTDRAALLDPWSAGIFAHDRKVS